MTTMKMTAAAGSQAVGSSIRKASIRKGGLVRMLALCACALFMQSGIAATSNSSHAATLAAMKKATTFMVDKVSYNGGYVWWYLPDLSRRWGEMEARETMIWIQPPGTASMGHMFLDAYHATGDEYYYAAAEKVAAALIWGQLPSGGWNYLVDFAGDRSLQQWYGTVGRNAWRLEEFQHYYGNGTFDDQVSTDAAKFVLRVYVEKHDPRYKPALDKAIQFVLDSQYPIGGWPQRYPLRHDFGKQGHEDYSSYITFNDDVAWENVSFLLECYQILGDQRLLDPINRGMNSYLVTQQGAPQPGWGLQYTLDLKPAAARTYEPKSLATHTTASNIGHLLDFYQLTGETKFLARVPEALDWLDSLRYPAEVSDRGGGHGNYTHPTFIELGTNKPLYVHRRGSNAINGGYYIDYENSHLIGHYSSMRRLDTDKLRKRYDELRAMPAEKVTAGSPLVPAPGIASLPRFFAESYAPVSADDLPGQVRKSINSLNSTGYWPAPLPQISHPYIKDGAEQPTAGDFGSTFVGDDTDTSPFKAPNPPTGITTQEYLRNMNILIKSLRE
jgi:hypothetical protein